MTTDNDIKQFLLEYKALCRRHGLYFEAGDEELIVRKARGTWGPHNELYTNGVFVRDRSGNDNHAEWVDWPEGDTMDCGGG